jgi:enoyl-CoA hydratase/carnithine racemase
MDELLVDKRGPVTLITLNRPDAHNSITAEMAVGLAEGIDAFASDDSARVLLITGAGDRAFLELADRIAGYPQASLRADRAATVATRGLSLDAGLDLEAGLCRPTVSDPEMLEGLRNFAAGDRPEAPRPA